MKKILMTLAMMASLCTAFAQNKQYKLTGTLVDEDNQPVEFANIVVKTSDRTVTGDKTSDRPVTGDKTSDLTVDSDKTSARTEAGGISDAQGKFEFSLGEGQFVLEASSVGYQTLTVRCSACDLGVLVMPKDIQQLQAAGVSAQRTVEKAGRFVVVPDPKDIAVSSKGMDLLDMQQLPGLRVDRAFQNITIDGGTPVFMINGREVQSNRLINLDPDKVKRIEYSNSPGLRYLDRGATGIINIVLNDPDDGGGFYIDAGSDPRLMMSDAYVSGNYHKGKSEIELQYYFSRRNYEHGPNEDIDSYVSEDRVVTRESYTERPVHYMVNNLGLEYTYQPSDSTMFVALLKDDLYESNNVAAGTMKMTDRGVTSEMKVEGDSPITRMSPKLDLYFSRQFPENRKLELNVVGEYNSSESSRNIYYTVEDNKTSYLNTILNNGWAISSEAVYGSRIGKVDTRAGVQYQYNFARNDYRNSNVVSEMTKNNTYAFIQAEASPKDNFHWSIGTGAKIFAVTDGGQSKTYVRNLSSAQLNWRLDECWTMTGEVRYTPALPSLSDLSPVLLRTDNVEASQGFADLKPSQTLASRVLVRYAAKNGWFANLTGGYNHSFGEIITTYRYDKETDLFVSSPQNSDYYKKAYVSGEIGVKGLFDFINFSLDGTLKREHTKGEGFEHSNDNLSINVNLQTVWDKFLAGASFNIMPDWYMNGEFLVMSERAQNIYVQYKWKSLTANLTWHCPFNPEGYCYQAKSLSEIHPAYHVNWTSDNGNMIVLGLTWNLDFGSAFKKGSKTLQNGGYDAGTVR